MGDMSTKNRQRMYIKRFLEFMRFHSYKYRSMSLESQTFAHSSSILGDVNIINIDPCHGNPRLLPIPVPYWMMCRHPKRKSQMGGM